MTTLKLTADDVRSGFLRFFEKRGHRVVSSSPLVPDNDPTLLFTNAGMNQFKDVFLGREKRDYTRATTSQKCMRAGGKHNDLENVGHTPRHHTFFEMLGNFSFGDYFKEEAIAFAWEFLTRSWACPRTGSASRSSRRRRVPPTTRPRALAGRRGVPADRILRFGEKDNFWAMGEHRPLRPVLARSTSTWATAAGDCPRRGRECPVDSTCDRCMEIWNLVFMQFDARRTARCRRCRAPSIDTGMGLERLAAVVQGEDQLRHRSLHADHGRAQRNWRANATRGRRGCVRYASLPTTLRACTFLIGDGVLPGNEGRGYVLRMILRRRCGTERCSGSRRRSCRRHRVLVEPMKVAYPELAHAPRRSSAS